MEVILKWGLPVATYTKYLGLGIIVHQTYRVVRSTGYGYTITVPKVGDRDVAREDFNMVTNTRSLRHDIEEGKVMVPDARIDREIARKVKEECKLVKPKSAQINKSDCGKSNPLLLEVDLAKALFVINRVLDYGAEKYERAGWKKVEEHRYDAAARRHRRDRDCGQVRDYESGLPHLAHEATNLLFQLQMLIESDHGADFYSYKKPPQDHKVGNDG